MVQPPHVDGLPLGELLARLEAVVRDLRDLSAARVIFGAPIVAEGRTVIPVAKLGGGLGGGLVNVLKRLQAKDPQVISGGVGLSAEPMGYIEIAAEGTRFVPIAKDLQPQPGQPLIQQALPFVAGLLLGALLRPQSRIKFG
jgi:uncharacterized spore protein YtfJ